MPPEPTDFNCPWCFRRGMTRGGLREHLVFVHREDYDAHTSAHMRTNAGDTRKLRKVNRAYQGQ